MDNPFVENNFLCSNVSINKLFIDKMSTDKIQENLAGKAAQDIFSTKLFIEEIKNNAKDLKLDLTKVEEKMLPQCLDYLLESEDVEVRETSEKIVRKFGERLGVILLTLKKGEKENRLKRKDWDNKHWDYWSSIENVILLGGLASSKVGERLKHYVEKVFKDDKTQCYKIILNKDSSNAGINGCATYIENPKDNREYLILDCGQTFIKRSIVTMENKKVKEIKNLNKVLSANVDWDFDSEEEEKIAAYKLHKHILNTILNTINESKFNLENSIVISVANYVRNGQFANRGGYGKLRLLTKNYEEFLSFEIYKETKLNFNIKLVHDGTAMATAFSDYHNAVYISLGTVFGVGFPIVR